MFYNIKLIELLHEVHLTPAVTKNMSGEFLWGGDASNIRLIEDYQNTSVCWD